jgi:hypothetical protein
MKLSDADAALFFELMLSLQIYANQQLKLVRPLSSFRPPLAICRTVHLN